MLERLISLLETALQEPSSLPEIADEYQQLVWNTDSISSNSSIEDAFRELAYDLDYFEPDLKIRRTEGSYHDQGWAIREIQVTLEKIRALGHTPIRTP